MVTLEHSAVTLLKLNGNENKFREVIPYILEPDSIRRYTGPRPYSHFECYNGETSWLKFPESEDLKILNKENIWEYCQGHLTPNIPPCVVGEETQIDEFERKNTHLKEMNFKGIKNHLIQDVIFDNFVRTIFDCSRRYDDIFKFNGKEIDGKEMRRLVQIVSEFGLYRLAFLNYTTSGVLINQEWYDKNVKAALDKVYSEDLANGTYNYMKIPENINNWITNADWKHFNEAPIDISLYDKMYTETINKMVD